MTTTLDDTDALRPGGFPSFIDSSMRSTYRSCPQKFYREYIQCIAAGEPGPDLIAGGAFAAGIEATRNAFYRDSHDVTISIGIGLRSLIRYYGEYTPNIDHPKTCEAMMLAFIEYFNEYPLQSDIIQPYRTIEGLPAVEFSFALPIPNTAHPITKDPIIYCGRFDMLGVYNGMNVVVDEKTTKQLGPTWSSRWALRSQFTGYCWGAKESGIRVEGFVVRGLSILKHGFGHAQYIGYRPQWMIDRWLVQLQRDVHGMIKSFQEGYWDYALDDACSAYGGCPMKTLCESPEPEQWLSAYVTRKWNPLNPHKEG